MKKSTTFNQQLKKLQERGIILPKDGSAKRFLEEENYYNVINGYKDIFLDSNADSEQYKVNTHFNELKSLFIFKISLLKHILHIKVTDIMKYFGIPEEYNNDRMFVVIVLS